MYELHVCNCMNFVYVIVWTIGMLLYELCVCNRTNFRYVFVGLPSKFRSPGNVGTTNSTRHVGTVSLMLFSLVHQKTCFRLWTENDSASVMHRKSLTFVLHFIYVLWVCFFVTFAFSKVSKEAAFCLSSDPDLCTFSLKIQKLFAKTMH